MIDVDLSGRAVVVTGAGRGLGRRFARALAEHGATVIIAELNDQVGKEAEAQLRAAQLQAHFLHLDVRDPDQVEAVAQTVRREYGRLDIWINNAGIALHARSEEVSVKNWQLSIDVMLSGTFYGAQAAGRIMIEQGGGHIINVASVNGFVAQAGRAAYCAAKAGVIRLTEVLAAEWAGYGVRVNALAPAVFATELMQAAVNSGAASLEVYRQRSPTGRLGELSELVHPLLFLASERSRYVTGQTLRVDGAWVSDHYL